MSLNKRLINTNVAGGGVDGQYMMASGYLRPIFGSSDFGATWSSIESSRKYRDTFISSTGQYQAATSDVGLSLSSDYGLSWSQPITSSVYGVAMTSTGQNISVFGNGSNVLVSSDFGVTFSTGASNNQIYGDVSADGQYQLSSGTFNTKPLLSTDFGATWNTISTTTTSGFQNCAVSASGQYMIAANNGQAILSTNYGVSWSQTSVSQSRRVSISATGQYIAIGAGTTAFGGWVSNDYGATFNKVTASGQRGDGNAISGDGKYIIFTSEGAVSSGHYLSYSDNYGASFSLVAYDSSIGFTCAINQVLP